LGWVHQILSGRTPAAIGRGCIVSVLALGVLEYSVGPELTFSVFYLLPIAAAAWYGTARSGPLVCGLAASVAGVVGLLTPPDPPSLWVAGWNTGVLLILFLGVGALVSWLRDAKEMQRTVALSDPLTGLANTRAFLDRLGDEIARGLRHGRVFTLVYLDLDRFKEVNDRLGHAEGDRVLTRIAAMMRETLRASDLPARLGGDEFGILLPETPFAQAERALGKLRDRVVEEMGKNDWPVTLSMGAVTFESTVETADDAVRIADGLMYAAKASGGDGIQHLLWTGE
jgi:diguanylate cyclase (GGDEF)-like protein